jgi:hypothetical protein
VFKEASDSKLLELSNLPAEALWLEDGSRVWATIGANVSDASKPLVQVKGDNVTVSLPEFYLEMPSSVVDQQEAM